MKQRFHDGPLGLAIKRIDWDGMSVPEPAPEWGEFTAVHKTAGRVFKREFDQELTKELRRTRWRPRARYKRVAELLLNLQHMVADDVPCRFTLSIDRALGVAVAMPRIASRGPVSTLAGALTDVAVALLPPAERARYREEFQSEMYELGQWKQIVYGVHQMTHSIGLRRSLSTQGAPAAWKRWVDQLRNDELLRAAVIGAGVFVACLILGVFEMVRVFTQLAERW